MIELREELKGFDMAELWFYVIDQAQIKSIDIWIVEGGRA